MLIFKRKRLADSLKIDAPNGTVFAGTESGWIDTDMSSNMAFVSVHYKCGAVPQRKGTL